MFFRICHSVHHSLNFCFISALIEDIFGALYVWRGARLRSVIIRTARSEYGNHLHVHGYSDVKLLLLDIHLQSEIGILSERANPN